MFKKIIFLLGTLCYFNVFTMHNMEQRNKEEILTLKRALWSLKDKLEERQKMKQRVAHEINVLRQEQSLMYHINQAFSNVFGPIKKAGSDYGHIIEAIMLPWEIGRLAIAYGLFPITIPLTTAYAASEWRSKKDNNDKILMNQKVFDNNVSQEKKIQAEIDYLENLIKEMSSEQ